MKSFLTSVHVVLVCILVGCGKEEIAVSGDASPKCEIQAAIDELPQRLNCRRWRETEWFVYSNICCAVRQIDDRGTRMRYSTAYTNKVWGIMSAAASGRDSEALENWRINLENYIAMVRWGFVLLYENAPPDVSTWDFLLSPIALIDSHKKWLAPQVPDFRYFAHVRMLGSLLDDCKREIDTYWYEGARHRMPEEQFDILRKKVRDAFGESPSEMADGDGIAFYEKGIRLGMGQGCKNDPQKALEAMKSADSLGYGPAALVCAMATEIKQGWMTTEEIGTNVVTAASRLRTYIGTADIGGWYDIYEGRPFVSSLGKNLEDDKFVAQVQAMYLRAKELGVDLAEEELKRFNATVACQREIVARRRQRQEAAERRELEHRERIRKSKEMREPLVYDVEPGWRASFAGYTLGQVCPPPKSGSVIIYNDTVRMYTPQKKLDAPFHGMDFLQQSLTPTSHRLFRISASKKGFEGDRKKFLDEGRSLLKDLGNVMGMELAPFKYEAPDWPYWPNGVWSGARPELYFADESQWATSRHVFAFSHTKKGTCRIDVRLEIIYDKPKSISMSILDCEGERVAEVEFDKAFRGAHDGRSWSEWCRGASDVPSRDGDAVRRQSSMRLHQTRQLENDGRGGQRRSK